MTYLTNCIFFFPSTFFSSTTLLSGPITKKACTIIKKTEELTHSANQQWWDCFFLKQCSESKISRGLHIIKSCSLSVADLKAEWEQISEFCPFKWIKFLITQRDRTFVNLKHQIESTITQLCTLVPQAPQAWPNPTLLFFVENFITYPIFIIF